MLSSNVHCMVVEVLEPGDTMQQDRFAARDLLPWADPYIAQLLSGPRFRRAACVSASGTLQRPPSDRRVGWLWTSELSPPWEEFRSPDRESLRRDQRRRDSDA